MFSKIVLCATSNRLTAGLWRLGKLQSYQVFQNDSAGQADFTAYLRLHAGTTIHLIADAVEEDYRLETLPHTTGRDQQQLVERKLGQLYRSNIYRTAHFIMRERDKRRDDRYLFAALNNADFLQSWVAAIEALQAPLAGVYLLPMISQLLVRRLKIMDDHILLSEQLSSGLRQTYMHNGRLRISRLAPIPPSAQNQLNYFYSVETEKTRLYLISQRFILRETALTMVLPALDDSQQEIYRGLEQEQDLQCKQIDMAAFARSVRLEPQLLQANPELLHMHLLAIGNVPDNLAPAGLIKNHGVVALKRTIQLFTALIVLAGLSLAGFGFYQAHLLSQKAEQTFHDMREQEEKYNEVARDFPQSPIASSELKLAVELQQKLAALSRPPHQLLQTVSKALMNLPELQVNRLRWVLSNDLEQKDENEAVTAALPVQSGKAYEQPGFVANANTLYEVIFLSGEIKRFNGDYRAALENVNKLVEALKVDPSVVRIVILQSPVNVSSYSSLQGTTTDQQTAQRAVALFKLRIVLKAEASS